MILGRHFNYANVMSTLAVFLALAGGSLAVATAGRDDIGSPQVDNNSLKSVDLKNKKAVRGKDVVDASLGGVDVTDQSLGGVDVTDQSLTGVDVGDDGLTGTDVLESSFAEVPTAANSDTVDGKHASDLQTFSAFAQNATNVDLTTSDQDIVSTSVTTEGTRVLAAVGTVELSADGGNNDHGRCSVRINDVDSLAYGYNIVDGPLDEESPSVTFARELGPGTHSVALRCQESAASTVHSDDAGLSVWAVGP